MSKFIRIPFYKLMCCVVSFCLLQSKGFSQTVVTTDTGKVIINVIYKQYKEGDSIRLVTTDTYANEREGQTFFPIKQNIDKSFRFQFPSKAKCGYFYLVTKRRTTGTGDMMIVDYQFWEEGDSITVKVKHAETNAGTYSNSEFSGRGSSKYVLWEKMSKIRMEEMNDRKPFLGNLIKEQLPDQEPTLKLRIAFLEENKSRISKLTYGVFKAALLSDQLSSNISAVISYYENNIKEGDKMLKVAFIKRFKEVFYPVNPYKIDDFALAESKDYIYALRNVFKADALMETGNYDPERIYRNIIDTSDGFVRQASLLMFFLEAGNNKKIAGLYKDAEKYMLSSIRADELKNISEQSVALIKDYSFKDQNGKDVKISDFKNKIILIDIWFWGCGGCAQYYSNVLSRLESEPFINKDVVILSISYDSTRGRWKKGMKEGLYTSNKAINVYAGSEIGFKHPIISDYGIVWFPTQMLIDRKGKIVNFKTNDLKTFGGTMKVIKELL